MPWCICKKAKAFCYIYTVDFWQIAFSEFSLVTLILLFMTLYCLQNHYHLGNSYTTHFRCHYTVQSLSLVEHSHYTNQHCGTIGRWESICIKIHLWLGMNQRNTSHYNRDTWWSMIIVALFIITRNGNILDVPQKEKNIWRKCRTYDNRILLLYYKNLHHEIFRQINRTRKSNP